ncbi:MAG: hypothetical protein ACE5E5_05780 [Phycisphaerae bacterium]
MEQRGLKLRQLTKEMLDAMGDEGRDRLLQRHLAQARGPRLNALLLRSMTRFMLLARKAQSKEGDNA